MAKKNIVFIAQSLDGYIAGKHGELDWLHSIPNPENDDMGYDGFMDEIDAIVMGRNTFETVLGFGGVWPYAKPVFVLSRSLNELPQQSQDKATLIKGNPKEVLTQIHEMGYFNLYIDGGNTIQNFLKEDMIDELRITTIPIVLGGGFPLFGPLSEPLPFEWVRSRVFLNQLVQNHYKRKR